MSWIVFMHFNVLILIFFLHHEKLLFESITRCFKKQKSLNTAVEKKIL